MSQTVVITGGGGHLGRSVARWWADRGVHVLLIDRDPDKLQLCRAELLARGARVTTVTAELTSPDQVREVLNSLPVSCWEAQPSLILAHGVAGKGPSGQVQRLGQLDTDQWRMVLDTNLTSIAFAIECFLPIFKRACGGRVVLVSSAAGQYGSPTATLAYSVSKAAVAALPRILAPELAELGVLINAVAPGKFYNPDWPDNPDQVSRYEQRIPLGRLASAHEVAELIGFLGSESNTYLTGQTILQDGGRLLGLPAGAS